MAVLTFDALLRGLKAGPLAPVYYLHGEDDVLKDEAARALTARAVEPALRDFNVDVRAAQGLDAASLRALVDTPPMLAERRVVVLRGVEELRKTAPARRELLRYLERPNPSTVLILVQDGDGAADAELARGATAVATERLPPERARRWILHRAKTIGLEIEDAAVELLLQAVGNDLAALGQELDKLAAVAAGRSATAADVGAAVGVRRGETVDDLVARALARDGARAAALVDAVLLQSGMTGVRVVSALGTHLVGVALARAEIDRGGAARAERAVMQHLLAARPGGLGAGYTEVARRWTRWAEAWTAAELAHALRLALRADRALKGSGVSDDRGIILELVLTLAVREREAA